MTNETATVYATDESARRKPLDSGLLNNGEACEYLGIGLTTLVRLARRNRLRKVKLGGRVMWPRAELDRLVRLCTRTAR